MLLTGCYSNETTALNLTSVEPWELNEAPLPAPTETDPCPEVLSTVDRTWQGITSMHARGCIHQPLSVVWRAIRDPQTGRDPTASNEFAVLEWDVFDSQPDAGVVDAGIGDGEVSDGGPSVTLPMPDYSYRTWVKVINVITLEFGLTWLHYLAGGTDQAPTRTLTRWQKTWGTTVIQWMEGSLEAYPLEGHPEITVVAYQYHLDAVANDDHGTVRNFLNVIYSRLRDRSNGVPLNPSDCGGCPPPPMRYTR